MELHALAGIFTVFALLMITLAVLRRFGWVSGRLHAGTGNSSFLRVVDSRRIEPGTSLYVIAVGEQLLVVATHASGCSVLATMAQVPPDGPSTARGAPQ